MLGSTFRTNLKYCYCCGTNSMYYYHIQHQVYTPSPSDYDCCGACKNVSCKFQMENGTSVIYEV